MSQYWTNIREIWTISTNIGPFRPILDHFDQFWTILTKLDHFDQYWTISTGGTCAAARACPRRHTHSGTHTAARMCAAAHARRHAHGGTHTAARTRRHTNTATSSANTVVFFSPKFTVVKQNLIHIHVTFVSRCPRIQSIKSRPPFAATMRSRDSHGLGVRAGLTSRLFACCRRTLA